MTYEYACQEWWPKADLWVTVGGSPGPLWQALDTIADWRKEQPDGLYRLVRREVQPWVEVGPDGEPVPATQRHKTARSTGTSAPCESP